MVPYCILVEPRLRCLMAKALRAPPILALGRFGSRSQSLQKINVYIQKYYKLNQANTSVCLLFHFKCVGDVFFTCVGDVFCCCFLPV